MNHYRDADTLPSDSSGGFTVYACTHCGCVVWDRMLHDQVNGLDLQAAGEQALSDSQAKRVE